MKKLITLFLLCASACAAQVNIRGGASVVQSGGSLSVVIEPGGNGTTFGNIANGSFSYPLFFLVTNTGAVTVTGVTISFTGTNASDFSVYSNPPATPINAVAQAPYTVCGSSITIGATCYVAVKLTPSGLINENGTLNISSSAVGSPAIQNLTGVGVAGTAISSCQTLNTSVFYYLTSNVTSTGTCFPITALSPNVNLNGHTVTFGTSGNSLSGPLVYGFEDTSTGVPAQVYNGTVTEGSCLNGSNGITNKSGGGAFGVVGGNGFVTIHDVVTFNCSDSSAALLVDFQAEGGEAGNFYNWTANSNKVTAARRDYFMGEEFYADASPGTTGTAIFHDIYCTGVNPQGCIAWSLGISGNGSTTEYNNLAVGGNPNGQASPGTASLNCQNNPWTNAAGTLPVNAGTQCSNDFAFGGLMGQGSVTGNIINVNEGRGIGVGGSGGSSGSVTGNIINAIELKNNSEYFSSSTAGCELGGAYGIELDLFGAVFTGTRTIQNNTVHVIAGACEAHGFSWSNSTGNPVINMSGNHFECDRAVSSTALCSGLRSDAKQYSPSGALFATGDTYLGDTSATEVDFDGSPAWRCNQCTFGKGTNPVSSGWVTFSFARIGGQSSDPWLIVDPTFTGGALKSSNDLASVQSFLSASYTVFWTYTVTVIGASSGFHISGATVRMTDSQGTDECVLTTSSNGVAFCILKDTNYAASGGVVTNTNFNPFSFTITKTGCTTLTYSESILSTTSETRNPLGC